LTEILIFDQTICSRCKCISGKILIFGQNLDSWPKYLFYPKFPFLLKFQLKNFQLGPKQDREKFSEISENIFQCPHYAEHFPSISLFQRKTTEIRNFGKNSRFEIFESNLHETGYKMVKKLKAVLRLIKDGNLEIEKIINELIGELFDEKQNWTKRGKTPFLEGSP